MPPSLVFGGQIMSKFTHAILSALKTVPIGYWQRIDGLRCENGVLDHDWWFFSLRLWLLSANGIIKRKYLGQSLRDLPSYQITTVGISMLEARHDG